MQIPNWDNSDTQQHISLLLFYFRIVNRQADPSRLTLLISSLVLSFHPIVS
jgi:hypothetical protein